MSERVTESDVPAAQLGDPAGFDEQTRVQLRSPLLVGCIAYAILTWMILVVIVIYIWRLFGA